MMGYHCRWKWKHRFLAMRREESLRIVVSGTSEYRGWRFSVNVQLCQRACRFTRVRWRMRWAFYSVAVSVKNARTPPASPAHTQHETKVTCYRLCHAFKSRTFAIAVVRVLSLRWPGNVYIVVIFFPTAPPRFYCSFTSGCEWCGLSVISWCCDTSFGYAKVDAMPKIMLELLSTYECFQRARAHARTYHTTHQMQTCAPRYAQLQKHIQGALGVTTWPA